MTDDFPPLPVPGALLADEPMWHYRSGVLAGAGYAHLRVWDADPGHVAIVTETGLGASTTNSAEHIWLTLV